MLKIGLLSPFLPENDGIAIYSNNILKGLEKNRESIVTIGRKGSKADYTVNFKSFSLKKRLKEIIKKEKLNLLHIQYVASLFSKYSLNYNLLHALNLQIPIIITLHEVQYSSKGIKNKVLQHIEKIIIKKADKIIVHTPNQKEYLKKKYKTNSIVAIYHGLRLNKVPKRKNKKNLLCFGMISHGKGVPYLIKAMKYLQGYNLTIAGKFVDDTSKTEVIKALKCNNSTIKTDFGWIDEKKKEKYYREADCVVLPHIWAPYQSGILHNAVAWGLPVVVTKVGALWEMADKFKFGVVVNPKDPKAIAEGIRKVFKDYNSFKKGIENYRQAANWPKIAKEHMILYGQCNKN